MVRLLALMLSSVVLAAGFSSVPYHHDMPPPPSPPMPPPPPITAQWEHVSPGCVSGNNIIKYAGKTVDECKALCVEYGDACKGIEYGVAHGGFSASYVPSDCQLSSSADTSGCNGEYYNLDVYVLLSRPPSVPPPPLPSRCRRGPPWLRRARMS